MRRTTSELDQAIMAAIMAGDDPVAMGDAAVMAKYGQPSDGQPSDGQPSDGQPSDGQPSDGQPSDGQDAPVLPERPQRDDDSAMEDLVRKIAREEDVWTTENHTLPMLDRLAEQLAKRAPQRTETTIKIPQRPDYAPSGHVHPQFKTLLTAVANGLNVMLVGPAGSGKTTAAKQVADALGKAFYFSGAVVQEHKLLGFLDANLRYAETPFYQAYTSDSVFLADEQDAWAAQPTLTINAHIANPWGDFPTGIVHKHEGFRMIAAANTYGRGADRQYVGRNQLDAATLDRYVVLAWEYDETAEFDWARQQAPDAIATPWVKRVQALRASASKLKVAHVISPRASIFGAQLLAAGIEQAQVEAMTIWKGLDPATAHKVGAAA